MAAAILEYVTVDERHRAEMKPIPELRGDETVEVVVRHPDGSEESASLPPDLARAVQRLVARASTGSRVAVIEEEQEISPNDAATILGMSRPLVVRRMDVGDLPFRYEGTHRRCKLRDVLALKDREDRRRLASDALAEDTEELMDRHGLS